MIQGEEQLEKMEEQKKEMEQNKEQNKEYFLELKQIYNTPIPKPDVSKQVHNQKFLFYIDLTNSEIYKNSLLQLSINNSIQREWQGGFLGEFQFHNQKKEQQHIFCYYFNKLIENNGNINIQNLFRFRLFLQEFISTQKNYQIKFVFHFKQKNGNQKEFEGQIVKFIYQVLEGSFDKLNDIICVYNNQESQQIKYCQISSKQIYFNNDQWSDEFDISFIKILDEFLEYFQYKQNDPNQIGQICQEYVQEYVNIVLKEFEEELLHLYKDIQLMLQFPVNLNNEKECNEDVKEYLTYLKDLLSSIKDIINQKCEFYYLANDLQKVLQNQKQKLIQKLKSIMKKNRNLEIYLIQNNKNKSPQEVIDQLLQFQFQLFKHDIQFLQKLEKHNFNQNCINKTLFMIRLNTKLWFEQFDLYLSQSLAYIMRITHQQQDINFQKPWVFVLGMTRVGKSTLLNILSDPNNIIINEYNRFDVKEKNDKIKVGHSNNSETFEISSLEIDNIIFYDTPGLRNTDQMNRLFNHLNFYNQIKQSQQAILLLMIDGEQLQISKNDLIDSIAQIQQIFGEYGNKITFENLIIPIFTKLKNDSTMEQIKQKWQTDTMKNITDKIQLTILNLIYTAINEDNYQKIYQAEFYQIQDQTKQKIQQLQEKANDCFTQNKNEDGQKYLSQMKELKQKQNNSQKEAQNSKMVQIKTDLIRKCGNILKEQTKNNYQFQKISLQLTTDQQSNLQKLLPYRDKFKQHILNIITHDFIIKMLYDKNITIDDKFNYIRRITKLKIYELSDMPKDLIKYVLYWIDVLDKFNNLIYQYDIKKQNQQAVDSNYFQYNLGLLYNAFTNVMPSTFWRSLNPFVSEEEKRKEEKLNLIKIQQEYQKQLQNQN